MSNNNSQEFNQENAENSDADNGNFKQAGRWTKEEHTKFVEALKLYGKNWKKVEEFVGSRSGAQIRSHAQKFFNRLNKELSTGKNDNTNQIKIKILDEDTPNSEANTAKKRSFSEFMSLNNDENNNNLSATRRISQDLNFNVDVDEKLYGLSKQIDNSITNIKVEHDDQIKVQKLAVWKDVITAIIGLTKQFVEELNGQVDATSRVEHYKSFLGDLRSQ